MLIPESEQRDLLIFAFKYALSRKTYVLNIVVDVLVISWDQITPGDRKAFKDAIKEAANKNDVVCNDTLEAFNKILQLKN